MPFTTIDLRHGGRARDKAILRREFYSTFNRAVWRGGAQHGAEGQIKAPQ
jgi:hypothetical protein